jgi:hypothetical protein
MGSKQIHNFIWGTNLSYDEAQKDSFNIIKKQTALQWFLDKLPHSIETQFSKQIQQALEMEQEQKIEFAKKCLDKALDLDIRTAHSKVEEYYNETYGVTGMKNKTFMSKEEWVKEYTGEKSRDIG